ncbi:hypothetical protein [Paracoccus sp. Ld10]|uniref:hypothetical protein n=1 Tax=Paracoccus sp. Ld10 TaxID=649158 RepID=UPI00386D9950
MSTNPTDPAAVTDPQPGRFNRVIDFLRHSEKRSNGTFIAIGLVLFAMTYLGEFGLNKAMAYFDKDPNAERLSTIETQTTSIFSNVTDIKDSLAALQDDNDGIDMTLIARKLDEIALASAAIVPQASAMANPRSGYLRGGEITEGPYTGTGTLLLNIDEGRRGAVAQLCDGATLAYSPKDQRFRLDVGTRSDSRYLSSAGALKSQDVTATISQDFQTNGALPVPYTCPR